MTNSKKTTTTEVGSIEHFVSLVVENVVSNELRPVSLYTESGLGKHMGHIHENRALSFAEILEIFKRATEGRLESVSEKLDGQNMFITYNVAVGELKFSRNKSQIKTGGMDGQDIVSKWDKLPSVRDAFYNAYITLGKAFAGIDTETLTTIFGPQGNIWYSIEVVSTFNPNVINYNQNAVIFHKVSLVQDKDGKVVNNPDFEREFAFLQNAVDDLQSAVADSKWKIMGPLIMQLNKATSDKTFKRHASALLKEAKKYGLGTSNTIGDYLAARFTKALPKAVEEREALGQIFGDPDLTPGDRKRKAAELAGKEVANQWLMTKNQQRLENGLIAPLEKIIYNFAVDVLEGAHSAIALNPDKEVKRLQATVKKQIELIKASGDENAIATMNKALKKLETTDKITSSMEGIVFNFGDRTYKLTGTFAPVNQLLGLFRF